MVFGLYALCEFLLLKHSPMSTHTDWCQAGEVPNRNGQFILAGFSGHGMPLIFKSAEAVAKMLREDASFEETALPKIFKPTEERLLSSKNDILGI